MGLFKKKEQYDYFEGFCQCARLANQAAEYLYGALAAFECERVAEHVEALQRIESEADGVKHTLTRNLAKEFITPIEREDISALAQEVDNIVDAIEEVMRKIYMFNILRMREDAPAFAKLIVECSMTFVKVTEEFVTFRKSKVLNRLVIQVNTLESEGDALHMAALRKLHTGSCGAEEKAAWTLIYASLEDCFDAFEHAADVVERVIMNNL